VTEQQQQQQQEKNFFMTFFILIFIFRGKGLNVGELYHFYTTISQFLFLKRGFSSLSSMEKLKKNKRGILCVKK